MARYAKKSQRAQRKRRIIKKVKQNGWMDDARAMSSRASQKAQEYGSMASQKAQEYGSMASQKARDMYGKATTYSSSATVGNPSMEMSKPRRPRRRTMKRVMKKRPSKKMHGIFDKEDILPTAAGAGAGALLGGGRGAIAGGLIGYGASKLLNRKRKD